MPDTPPTAFDGVIVVGPGADRVVGGLRLVERSAFVLARAGARRLLCLGNGPEGGRWPDVPLAWAAPDEASFGSWIASAAPAVIVASATTVVDPETVVALACTDGPQTRAAPAPAVLWRTDPSTLREWVGTKTSLDLAAAEAEAWRPPPDGLLTAVTDEPSRALAERALYARLGRRGDGWFTRHVDRRFSRAITRILLPTGVPPNAVTLVSIAIGILGGCCFAAGTPMVALAGALLFLASTIIDGCDGEIARLTFRESAFGARLDILGDNLVHLFLFGGISVGLYRRSSDPAIALLGSSLVLGVCVAMASVYLCIVRRDPNPRQRQFFEAFASREFAYLLVVLTVAGRLDWFLWLSAVGTYVFALGLFALGRRAD